MQCFADELELLKASYNSNELEYYITNKTSILVFALNLKNSLTFKITKLYPQEPAQISLRSSEHTNSQKQVIENELRQFASHLIGAPMIMEIVNKGQDLLKCQDSLKEDKIEESVSEKEIYTAVILIDHMRQKRKYSKTLLSWTSELNISGGLLFCQKIYLILQGTKRNVKEFIVRLKTVTVDVDSSGKPCKEKMSKVLFENTRPKQFSSFVTEEFSSLNDLKAYLISRNLEEINILI